MAKIRTTKTSAKSANTESESTTSSAAIAAKTKLGPESSNPPQIFILPELTSDDARIVTLQNPRYRTDSRYLICPERGFFEFTKIAAPKPTPRSWLLASQDGTRIDTDSKSEESDGDKEDDISKGYVTKTANMFIATPLDPLFLLLPAMSPTSSNKASESSKKLFLAAEDYLDRLTESSSQLKTLLRIAEIRMLLESRMASVCDTVDAGDEVMYRMNDGKLLDEIWRKVQILAGNGLPESMEEKFVRKALDVPVLCLKRDESFLQELRDQEEAVESGKSTPATESADSQATILTTATSFTEGSTAASSFSSATVEDSNKRGQPVKPAISAPEGVADLLRFRTAFNFISSAYLPPHISQSLKTMLTSSSTAPIDFTPLDDHITYLAKLRADAIAARSLNDMTKKRAFDEDEEDERAEKKRKKEEDEKRKKAGESQGVKKLKKVNVTGMKKMSDFFKKKV